MATITIRAEFHNATSGKTYTYLLELTEAFSSSPIFTDLIKAGFMPGKAEILKVTESQEVPIFDTIDKE